MVFYPDNQKRATRLQQLVDSCANMQTDIKHASDEFVDTNKELKPVVDSLMRKGGFDSFDDLYAKALAKMTEEERKKFEALIESAKKFSQGIEVAYFIMGMLMLPEGGILTGKLAVAGARFVLRLSGVQAMAEFFRASESGATAAAKAASELAKAAEESSGLLKEAGVSGEAGAEISRGMRWMRGIGTFFKWLGAVGFVLTILVGLIEWIEGAEQKEKLVDGIHNVQASRLAIKFYKREGENINQNLQLFKLYLKEMNKDKPRKVLLEAYQEEIYGELEKATDKIDWEKMEDELERQDRSAGNYYGDDDLPRDEVLKRAQEEK